jgi:hypothetical protein
MNQRRSSLKAVAPVQIRSGLLRLSQVNGLIAGSGCPISVFLAWRGVLTCTGKLQ